MAGKVRILVVDDEQIVLDSICKHLRKEDYILDCVLSAPEALERVKAESYDIVLTDLMMPQIDGLELMKLIKDDAPTMPVIMITGYATINTALQATQLGAFDYIAKPFSKAELKAVVNRAVELVRSAEPASGDQPSSDQGANHLQARTNLKSIGEHSWMMMEDDGIVLLGVDHSFLNTIGRIQTVYLPEVGDELRQGSAYLQIFSSDMRSHTVHSPLSGEVTAVNQKVLDDPATTLQDPYEEGWLIRLKPSRFEQEIKLLGL